MLSTVINRPWLALLGLLATLAPVYGQRYEITPLFGGRFGGTIKAEDQERGIFGKVALKDSASFGVAAGFHFTDNTDFDYCEGCAYIGFRWMRQKSKMRFDEFPLTVNPLTGGIAQPSYALDHLMGEFVREWPLEDNAHLRPFVTASVGAAVMSTDVGRNTRFAFGLGGGTKIFPTKRFGIRLQFEWLPTVMHAEIERLACYGGCIVGLGGGLLNQFEVTIGPIFKF